MKPMKPILFNTPMVQAIDEDRKTATRRLVTPQPIFREGETGTPVRCDDGHWCFKIDQYSNTYDFDLKPRYEPGDILYVRETWQKHRIKKPQKAVPDDFKKIQYSYRADGELANSDGSPFKWRPSIHMPKEAARIFLRVTDVWVERLNDITNDEAMREGCKGVPCDCSNTFVAGGAICCVDCNNTGWIEPPLVEFWNVWDTTIKKEDLPTYGWDANPWVWVYEFEKISKEEATKC